MPDHADAVRNFANALRSTLRAGDEAFPTLLIERKILQSIVAAAAFNASNWVHTRMENGDIVGKPLAELVPDLTHGDVIGGGLAVARAEAYKQARSLVLGSVTGVVAPAWVGSVVAVAAGLFGFAQEAGTALGTALIPLLVGGGATLYVLVRAVAVAPSVLEGVGHAAGSAWNSAGQIGALAEGLFQTHAGSATQQLVQAGYRPPPVPPPLTQLRNGTRLILGCSWAVTALCCAFFALGVSHAFEAYSQPPSLCTITLSDGTCLGS